MHKKKVLTMGGYFPCCKIRRIENSTCICFLQRIKSVPDGCQVCISEWNTRRGSLYLTTWRIFWPNKRHMVCKLYKDLYGLKQAPRSCYERLQTYLLTIGFARINDNENLYLKIEFEKGILLSKIFFDDFRYL